MSCVPFWEKLVRLHEAAHTVIAAAVGHHRNGAAVEKTANGCRGIAQHFPATLPEGARDHPTFENFDGVLPDFRKATDYAQLAVGPVGWLRYQRTLWIRTDAILAQHWLAVKMLASELHATGTMRRARARNSSTGGCRCEAIRSSRCWPARKTAASRQAGLLGRSSASGPLPPHRAAKPNPRARCTNGGGSHRERPAARLRRSVSTGPSATPPRSIGRSRNDRHHPLGSNDWVRPSGCFPALDGSTSACRRAAVHGSPQPSSPGG